MAPIYKGINMVPTAYLGSKQLSSVYFRGQDLLYHEEPIEYDYISYKNVDTVAILYTTDTHLRWKGNAGSDYYYSPTFSLDEIAYHKDFLWDNNIPAFCVDCGDWVHGSTNTEELRDQIINFFNNCGTKGYNKYLAVTFGNHEWYNDVGSPGTIARYLNRVNNMTVCNYKVNNVYPYKGWRAIKIGKHKIGIIGVGYPAPNNRGDEGTDFDQDYHYLNGTYCFLDAFRNRDNPYISQPYANIYTKVQAIIDMFKENDFDYIIAITHMDKYTDEDFDADKRFNSRADFLAQNTKGLDMIIPGHYNYQIKSSYTIKGLDGKDVKIVPEAGASCYSFGKIKLHFDGTSPEIKLLTKTSELDEV